jgi:hypothetical protein
MKIRGSDPEPGMNPRLARLRLLGRVRANESPMNLVKRALCLTGLCAGCLFAAGCDPGLKGVTLAGKWEYTEGQRLQSPDSQVEAVVFQGDAGSTTSTITCVCILIAGEALAAEGETKRVFCADHLKGLKLVWKETGLLEIRYDEARILDFKNYWLSPRKIEGANYVVEIRLGPTQIRFSLPLTDRMW